MDTYDVTSRIIPTGETKYVIINRDLGPDSYFAGYDFMGSVDWTTDVLSAYYMDRDEADQIANDLADADAPLTPPADKEYLLKTECDDIRQASIKTGRQIADIYEMDQIADIYSSLTVYDLETLQKISLLDLVEPILNQKRWMEQEYRDYCDAVNEYGYDFEGRDDL